MHDDQTVRTPVSGSDDASTGQMWEWIWPRVGPTPISQGLDTEMFDRPDYPYSETFVREAIQNSLDARLNPEQPVIISFNFHSGSTQGREGFLERAVEFRRKAGYSIPDEWGNGQIKWLTIEDFNARGLGGDLRRRMSDFWNYWLNFGVSNKDGSGRGGRGIGRVTFLIASRLQTVIGLTRRSSDGHTAACGMCVLKAFEDATGFHSTHAYLASGEANSIYHLYNSGVFHRGLEQAFGLSGYSGGPHTSGLALVIPYPHPELDADGILASAIEHFAPAILNGTLVVRVNGDQLDETTIEALAGRVAARIHAEPISKDPIRYLALIRRCLGDDLVEIPVSDLRADLPALRDQPVGKKLQSALDRNEMVGVRLSFALERNGQTYTVKLRAALARAPHGKLPVDRFFREGMALPEVKARNPGVLDAVILVDDRELATYLNFCEGKAHLDLLESKDIKSKLEENGFRYNFRIKRFVKSLPVELRNLLTPNIAEPDADVFSSFFSIPSDRPGTQTGAGDDPVTPPPPPPPPPEPVISAAVVEKLDDGFRIKANPKFDKWPVNVAVRIAYADGSRNPAWSEFDFMPSDLSTEYEDCDVQFAKNRVQATNCGPGFSIAITGFDAKRELDTRIRTTRDAQAD
jgi:hypothetical protein